MINQRIKFLKKYLGNYKGATINITISSILVTIIGINWPLIFKLIVDEVFINNSVEILKYLIGLYFFMFLFEKFIQFLWRLSDVILSTELLDSIRQDIFKKIFLLKSEEKDNISSGQIVDILNNDTKKVYELIVSEGILTITSFLRFLISITYICLFNIKVGLVVIFLIPLTYFLSNYFKNRFKVYVSKLKREEAIYNSWFFDILSGLRELKYLSSTYYVRKNFFLKLKRMCFFDIKQEIESSHNDNSQEMLNFISDIIIYAIIAYAIIFDSMTIGEFVAINIYYGWSKYFFRNVISFFVKKERMFLSIDRIINLLNLQEEEKSNGKFENGDIVLKNVHFAYDRNKILDDLTLTIKRGESTAIVGQSGSGKSTIASLIFKFYEPTSGEVLINNKSLQSINTINLRNSISIVRQEQTIFYSESIRNNLRMVKENATDEELWKALKMSKADEFVSNLPQKLDEVIDINNNLSSGQIQRIMLARTFLRNSEIIIFDEATSNLDIETEIEILESLKKYSKDKTLLIIAYRANALKDVDNIYFIDQGKIIEKGTHSYLSENCVLYSDLIKTSTKKEHVMS